ncbi:aspartate/glutamate racemase family protein [Sagittula sp. NFXS13]|uniref:aspartate/glutamate racemase family protein n=1 Tax=Sagittula sp. NFXS13 TaxID=2819095 RepID=UPI0032DF358C
MARILLMNPNSNAATTAAMVRIARTILPDVQGWTAPSGPPMIVDAAALDAAAELVAGADLPAVRGVIVSAFGDPGQGALARRLSCPVVGIGGAAAVAAAAHGAFAVATTTPGLRGRIDALMSAQEGYLGCFLTEGDPLDLMADPERLDAALRVAAERSVAAGAEAVIIGGGPLGEAAERLSAQVCVPLISPIRAAAQRLENRLTDG